METAAEQGYQGFQCICCEGASGPVIPWQTKSLYTGQATHQAAFFEMHILLFNPFRQQNNNKKFWKKKKTKTPKRPPQPTKSKNTKKTQTKNPLPKSNQNIIKHSINFLVSLSTLFNFFAQMYHF